MNNHAHASNGNTKLNGSSIDILVLHIEDNLDDTIFLQRAGRQQDGYHIEIVHSPSLEEALLSYQMVQRRLQSMPGLQKEPILVVDFNFGRKDSRETIEQIRAYESESALPRAPSILFTGLELWPMSSHHDLTGIERHHDCRISKNIAKCYSVVARQIIAFYHSLTSVPLSNGCVPPMSRSS